MSISSFPVRHPGDRLHRTTERTEMTEYAVLLPGDESAWENLSAEDQAATFARHEEFSKALEARGHKITGGAELTHSRASRTIRRTGDVVTVTDGPYAETVEQLSGFYTVESGDLDDLVEVCKILSDADGGIEIRACVDHSADAG
jgi:hypothetical protein